MSKMPKHSPRNKFQKKRYQTQQIANPKENVLSQSTSLEHKSELDVNVQKRGTRVPHISPGLWYFNYPFAYK